MGRVLTEDFTLQSGPQTSFGVPGTTVYKQHEPNGVATFGPEITTTPRDPISQNRQRRKGTPTDLDSNVEFEADLTLDSATDFSEEFVMAAATGTLRQSGSLHHDLLVDLTLPILTTEGFAFDALAAAIPVGQLIYTRGFQNSANNGFWEVTDSNTTEVEVDGGVATGLVAETPGNTDNARLETGGFRFTDLTWTDATNTLGSASVDLTTIGLTVGQVIYIGGYTAGTRFTNGTAWARVTAIATATITVDKVTNDLGTGLDGGGDQGADAVDLLYRSFIRNVPRSNASFLERYRRFEGGYPNQFETEPPTPVANPDGFEYAKDNLSNSMAIAMPGQDKSVMTLGYVGSDTDPPVDNGSRDTNATSAAQPVGTEAFNTSADFARLRIQDVDETGLTTDIVEMTATFLNNVSPEKVLAVFGARFLNFGNFFVDIEMTALLTSSFVIARIRNNTTVTMDWILSNSDGALAYDIPSATLGNGGKDLPRNETIKINLTGQAFQDATLGYSLGLSVLPPVPTS